MHYVATATCVIIICQIILNLPKIGYALLNQHISAKLCIFGVGKGGGLGPVSDLNAYLHVGLEIVFKSASLG